MLAPGARPRIPAIAGVNNPRIHTLRNLSDMDRIIADTAPGMNAVVLGAGFIGLETAEQLHRKGLKVKIVQKGPHVLPQVDAKMAIPLENALAGHGIELFMNDEVMQFEDSNTTLSCRLASGKTLKAEIVILSIGIEPDTGLALSLIHI